MPDYFDEFRPFRFIRKVASQRRHVLQQFHRVVRIDFVRRVAWLVIIAVQSGEEKQNWNLFRRERSMVAGIVHIRPRILAGFIHLQRSRRLHVVQKLLQIRSRFRAAHEHPAFADPPDHIQIQHRHSVFFG